MPASDRYSLIVESQTRGEAALKTFEQTMERIANVTSRAQTKVSKSSDEATASAEKLGNRIRGAISDPLGSASASATQFATSLGTAGVVASGFAAAIGTVATASFALVSSTGDAAEGMLNLADRTGLSLSQIDRLQAMARVAGVSIEGLGIAGKTLSNVLQSTGKESDEARQGLRGLGVSFYDLNGNMRDTGEVLDQVLRNLGNAKTQAELSANATKVLGRAGIELLPLIKNYRDLDETARSLGFGTRDGLLKGLAASADEIDKLGLKWDILKGKLAVPATAVVTITTKILDTLVGDQKAQGFESKPLARGPVGEEIDRLARLAQSARSASEQYDAALDQRQREAAADSFRRRLESGPEGLKTRLSSLTEQSQKLEAKLLSPDIGRTARETAQSEYDAIQRQKRSTELALAAANASLEGAKNAGKRAVEIADILRDLGNVTEADRALENLVKTVGKLRELGAAPGQIDSAQRVLQSLLNTASLEGPGKRAAQLIEQRNEADVAAAVAALDPNSPRFRGNAPVFVAGNLGQVPGVAQNRAFAEGLADRQKRDQEQLRDIAKQAAEFEIRRVQLLAGPGGEVAALERITTLRLQQIDIQRSMGAEVDAEAEKRRVLQDRELELLDIQRTRLNEYKNNVGQAFDALISRGGGGLRDFARSQFLGLGRTLAQNVAGETFSAVNGRLSIPGQTKADGTPSFIGRLLANTPFADAGLKTATELNTLATTENTAALRFSAAGGTGVAGLASRGGFANLPSQIFGGFGSNPFIPGAPGGTSGFAGPVRLGANGYPSFGAESIPTIPNIFQQQDKAGFFNQYGSTATTAAVYGGALAAGGFGVYSGIKKGGPQGFLTAASAALGTAAALSPEPVSKAVLAIAAVAAGMVTQLFPDPKKKRDAGIDRLLEGARYQGPESQVYDIGFGGGSYDTNFAGDIRPIVVQVQTMDAQSFIDRRDDIAAAVSAALIDGNPQLNQAMREVTALA